MWNTFAAISGGAAGGLTGLVFIVVSFRSEVLGASVEYRSRAAQVLTLFLTVTVVAVLIAVPQYDEALGIEMILVAMVCATILRSLDTTARREQTTHRTPTTPGPLIGGDQVYDRTTYSSSTRTTARPSRPSSRDVSLTMPVALPW